MVLVISVWRMISAVWYMTTTAWGLHLYTLEATVPCHGLGQAQWVWTGADSGKTTKWCSALNAEYVQSLFGIVTKSVVICRSCEDTLDSDMVGVDPYTLGVPMMMDRGSMASLDSTLRKPPPTSWRQPELPEVIAMLNYRLDPVKTNAAAFLQHLTFKNDKVKSSSQLHQSCKI